MHEDLIKRLRNGLSCYGEKCLSCQDRKDCVTHYEHEAADVIEELTAYVQQIEELREDGYYLQKLKMMPFGQVVKTGPLPKPPMKVGKLHVGKNGVVSITEIPEEEE